MEQIFRYILLLKSKLLKINITFTVNNRNHYLDNINISVKELGFPYSITQLIKNLFTEINLFNSYILRTYKSA